MSCVPICVLVGEETLAFSRVSFILQYLMFMCPWFATRAVTRLARLGSLRGWPGDSEGAVMGFTVYVFVSLISAGGISADSMLCRGVLCFGLS